MTAGTQQTQQVSDELDALIAQFFEAVSFEEGQRPHYDHIQDLFIERGLLIKNSAETPEISTVPEFVAPRQAMLQSGELTRFHESELAQVTEIFGNVAHRLCGYKKTGTLKGVPFEACGVITTQFIRTPQGWRISSMAWDDERAGLSIPDRYRINSQIGAVHE